MRVAPDQAPCQLPRIRIEEELVRIETQSALGLIRALHAVTVELSRRDIVEVAVPDVLGAFRQRDALDLAPTMAVEQAKLHFFGIGRKQREISSAPVPSGSQRMRRPCRNPHTTPPEREKLSQVAEQQRVPPELGPGPRSGPRPRSRHCCRRTARNRC